jgi:hypothetical protein
VNLPSAVMLQAKLLRRRLRRVRQARHFPSLPLAGTPILFANSFPKSGTHLLTQVLAAFSGFAPVVDSSLPPVLTFDGPSGRQRTRQAILSDLGRLLPGDLAYGHLHASPEVVSSLCRDGVAPFFIYRDPRDVVVSHVYYITEMAPNHVHHAYYTRELHSFEQRLRVSILGRPELPDSFPDIRRRFEPYLPWLERPEVLSLRFEDFLSDPQHAFSRIFDHAVARGLPYNGEKETALGRLAASVHPERSPTFRQGRSGAWKDKFTPEIKALFKDVAGGLLVSLGYEKDLDW